MRDSEALITVKGYKLLIILYNQHPSKSKTEKIRKGLLDDISQSIIAESQGYRLLNTSR